MSHFPLGLVYSEFVVLKVKRFQIKIPTHCGKKLSEQNFWFFHRVFWSKQQMEFSLLSAFFSIFDDRKWPKVCAIICKPFWQVHAKKFRHQDWAQTWYSLLWRKKKFVIKVYIFLPMHTIRRYINIYFKIQIWHL